MLFQHCVNVVFILLTVLVSYIYKLDFKSEKFMNKFCLMSTIITTVCSQKMVQGWWIPLIDVCALVSYCWVFLSHCDIVLYHILSQST